MTLIVNYNKLKKSIFYLSKQYTLIDNFVSLYVSAYLISKVQSRCIPIVGGAKLIHHIRMSHAQIWRRLSVNRPDPSSRVSNQVPTQQTALLNTGQKKNGNFPRVFPTNPTLVASKW